MTSCEAARSDHVHVVVNSLSSHFLGSREESSNIDIVTKVGKSTGNHLSSSVVAVLAHLGNEDSGVAAVLLGEIFDGLERVLVFESALLIGILHGLLRVSTSHNLVAGNMTPRNCLNGVGNLPDGGSELGGLDCQLQEVALPRFGTLGDLGEDVLNGCVVAGALDLLNSFNLLFSHLFVVDLEHLEVLLLLLKAVLVHTHLHFCA